MSLTADLTNGTSAARSRGLPDHRVLRLPMPAERVHIAVNTHQETA
jgi:hypothetical protein